MKVKFVALMVGLAGIVFGGSASANLITLTAVDGNLYQQTVQSPCIFSNPSCQQGTFTGTPLPTGGDETGYDSTATYSGATLLSIIGEGNSLLLGLDINQASGQPSQTLTGFTMAVNSVIVDTYVGSTGNVPAGNNGNGYADYLLGNFSSFLATDEVAFHFVFDNANDGTENVFLIGAPCTENCNPPQIPEPMSLALFGIGALGLALTRRRKQA